VVGQPQLSPQSDEADHDRTRSTHYQVLTPQRAQAQEVGKEVEVEMVEGVAAVAARPGKIELTKVTIPTAIAEGGPPGAIAATVATAATATASKKEGDGASVCGVC
jgi:hypothetical protein